MDPVLSTLFSTHNIGSDGFNWFVGQVENTTDIKPNGGRIQVRIVGVHHREGSVTPTPELPWANVMLPVNVPFSDGASQGANNMDVGCWVVGFYLDSEKQKPLVIGSIGHTPGSTTTELAEIIPGFDSLAFTPVKDRKTTVFGTRDPKYPEGKKPDGSITDSGQATSVTRQIQKLKESQSKTNPTGAKVCVDVADPNCDSKKIDKQIKKVIAELLRVNQQSGGNIGSFYVGQANGLLYDAVSVQRKYVGKITRIISSFSLRVKQEIVYGVREGVEELIKLIVGVQTVKEAAEKGADIPKNPKESYVPNTERGNFLKQVIDTFNKILSELGCSFTKTIDDLIKFLTDLIFEYLEDAFSPALCLIDNITNNVVKFLETAFNDLISGILSPIQDLLSEAGSFLDVIGGAINRVLNLLGISCTGLSDECNSSESRCNDGDEEDEDEEDPNTGEKIDAYLDALIKEIEGGSLTGKPLGPVSRGVCPPATQNSLSKPTKVRFVGGILNNPPSPSYVSTSVASLNIPIETPEYLTDIENAPEPLSDYSAPREARESQSNFVDYIITAEKEKIKMGEDAVFGVVGPLRNTVLEIEWSGRSIQSEAGNEYEECEIISADGLGTGFTVQASRDVNGAPFVAIIANGVNYLNGEIFFLKGSKVGGEDGDDDIKVTITEVGEIVDFRIFGDIFDKRLIDTEEYQEFGQFKYTVPTTFRFPILEKTNVTMPSYIGLEFVSKRASDSIIIWEEDPEDEYRVDQPEISEVTLTTDKKTYVEGENIVFDVEIKQGYTDGQIFTYQIFGDVTPDDYQVYTRSENNEVPTSNGLGSITVLTNDDFIDEGQEILTVILFDENGPVASSSVFVVDELDDSEDEEDPFILNSSTTNEQLRDFINSQNLTTTTDFGDTQLELPPDLGGLPPQQIIAEPPEIVPPQAGTPIVDGNGSIISIPINFPGSRSYQVPPKIAITGEGFGASGIALLDDKGFVSEVRVTRVGTGYLGDNPEDSDIGCIIDSFTIIRPGFGYTENSVLYIDDDPDVAELIVDENGFIAGARVLNRNKLFTTIPRSVIIGGGDGGFILPNLVCLPPLELEQRAVAKIGTGTYIDCP